MTRRVGLVTSGLLVLLLAVSAGARARDALFVFDPKEDDRVTGLEVRQVAVAGTFNGWNKGAHPMTRGADGLWRATIRLDEGAHHYKIVVNDAVWLEDRRADPALRVDDGTGEGGFNSGVEIREEGGDHGVATSNHVNRSAMRHDPVTDLEQLAPGRVRLRVRTLAGDVERVTARWRVAANDRTAGLERTGSERGFDFFEAVIAVANDAAWFEYDFLLEDGSARQTLGAADGARFFGFTGVVRDIPEWAGDAVWYQIFPERFRNGDPANDPRLEDLDEGMIAGWRVKPWGSDWYAMDSWERDHFGSVFRSIFTRRYGGDLAGIIAKLDYLKDLGITAIYLNPIFRSPSLHKYDGSSFHHVEETFGPDPEGDRRLIAAAQETEDPATWVWTAADRLFLTLLSEAHRREMRVIIDGVFNHSGRGFFAFQDLLARGPASRYAGWYEVTRWDTATADGFDYKGWYGHKSLPEFRRDEAGLDPAYKRYVFEITRRWMAPEGRIEDGVDGWRLDVAFCLPHGFWKEWRRHVKAINAEAYITGEVVKIAPDFLRGDEFDGLMNYPFAYAAVEFFVDRRDRIPASEFDRRLAELRAAYPEEITAVMQNLYASHDVPRLRTLIVNPDMKYRDFGGHFQRSKIEVNPSYRIDRGGAADLATHRLMAVFQMTYLGAPMIYYGDEIGMTGANDPDCRKPMLWEDIACEDEAVHPVEGRKRPVERNAPDQDLRRHYRDLIRLRNSEPALRRGTYRTILVDDERRLFGFERGFGGETITVLFNAGETAAEASLPYGDALTWMPPVSFVPLPLSRSGKEILLRLPPRSARILKRISAP
jgi:glycosidase